MNTKLNASEKNDRFLFRQQKVMERCFSQYVPYTRAKAKGNKPEAAFILVVFFFRPRICHLSRSLQSWNSSAHVTLTRLSEQTHISAITLLFVAWTSQSQQRRLSLTTSASLAKEDITVQNSPHVRDNKQCDERQMRENRQMWEINFQMSVNKRTYRK